jgi:hypothetical protein
VLRVLRFVHVCSIFLIYFTIFSDPSFVQNVHVNLGMLMGRVVRLPVGANFSGFNDICAFSGR